MQRKEWPKIDKVGALLFSSAAPSVQVTKGPMHMYGFVQAPRETAFSLRLGGSREKGSNRQTSESRNRGGLCVSMGFSCLS